MKQAVILVFLLLLLGSMTGFAMADELSTFAVVGESGGRLLQPSDGSMITLLTPGAWVHILEAYDDMYLVQNGEAGTGLVQKAELTIPQLHLSSVGVVTNPSDREYLNLRAEPSLQASVVDTFYNGVPCLIHEHLEEGWYAVSVGEEEGYFREEFLRIHTWPYASHIVTVHTPEQTGVNMRSGPGYEYPACTMCDAGSYLMLLESGKEWWYVAQGEQTGFIRSVYLYDGLLNPVFQDESILGATAIVNNPGETQVLNMRALPTKSSDSLRQYTNGARLILLAQGTEWCRVTDGEGTTGYCMTAFLRIQNGQEVPHKKVVHPEGEYVNLRNAPTILGSRILCQVSDGETVTIVVPDVDGWTIVRYGDLTGYMSSLFLE